MIIAEPSVKVLWVTPNAEKQIEIAGRTCYKSEDKITDDSAKKFVKMLYESGHHAMLEHAVMSVKVVTDRGITHEIVRHRLASYAQESTRFVNYSREKFEGHIQVILPPQIKGDAMREHIWRKSTKSSERAYFELLESGCSPQIARSVLPTCTKTELVITMNLREWIHFFKLRTSPVAHPQIISLSKSILKELCKYVELLKDI
jgi:thymidylate synthase (FAD)